MDPSWRTKGLDLYSLLHNQAIQYELIHLGHRDLREGDEVEETDWLGNPPPASSAGKRRKPVGNTLPDLLMRADADEHDGAVGEALFAPVVDAAEGLLQQTTAYSLHLSTWLVLFFLLVSPTLRGYVMRGTRPAIAAAYFEGFEARISTHVCGTIAYTPRGEEKRAKSGSVLCSAISPVEAVAAEWAHLDSLVRRGQPRNP